MRELEHSIRFMKKYFLFMTMNMSRSSNAIFNKFISRTIDTIKLKCGKIEGLTVKLFLPLMLLKLSGK
jgi:hypothetical protein